MPRCPCCQTVLLRHIRRHRIYWGCLGYREEMPSLRPQLTIDTAPQRPENLLSFRLKLKVAV